MEKNKLKGFKIFIIIFIGLSLIIFSQIDKIKTSEILSPFGQKEKDLELLKSLNNDEIFSIDVYDGNIIEWKYNRLSFSKSNGDLISEKDLNFSEPEVYYGEKAIYIFDREYGDIYSFDKKGASLDRLQYNKRLYNIKESNENLIVHFKNPGEESLNILDKNRVLLGNYFFQGENILNYGVNKGGDKIALASLSIGEDSLVSSLHFYGENNEKLGAMDLKDELVLYLNYIDKDQLIGLTDKAIYSIKDGEVVWREARDYTFIKDLIVDDRIYLLYRSYLDILDLNGDLIDTIGFGHDYKRIKKSKGNILVYGPQGLSLLSRDKNVLDYSIPIEEAYIDKDKIYVFGPEDIKIFAIRDKDL